MKPVMLDLIACPHCHSQLKLERLNRVSGNVESGTIVCSSCGRSYPIINGIPRFLSRAILNDEKLSKTALSFSYEWEVWDKLPDFAESCFLNVVKVKPEFFEGKTILDVGCGNGRFLLSAASYAGNSAVLVGVDLSNAVDSAYRKTHHVRNVHLIQADLYDLPLKKGIFDIIYCIGVLQHLPNPRKAIIALSQHLSRTGGLFVGTVYTKPDYFSMRMFVFLIKGLRKSPL